MSASSNTYTINNIFLARTDFQRTGTYEAITGQAPTTNVAMRHSLNGNTLHVELVCHVWVGESYQKAVLRASALFMGVFNVPEGDPMIEAFATINAPAIMFPFVREHIVSLCTKANIPAIICRPNQFCGVGRKEKEPITIKPKPL